MKLPGVRQSGAVQVLVAEDDRRLAALLDQSLSEAGWDVEVVHDGKAAFGRALPGGLPYDVLLLDWMLPEIDGLTVCRRLRDVGLTTPVLMLTARGDVRDRISGLDAGADDYLAKPFGLAELLARLRALMRRTDRRAPHGSTDHRLSVDIAAHRVRVGEREVALTGKEFDVLAVLDANRDKVVSRAQLMSEVWSETWYGSTKTLDVTIGRLRQKLEQVGPDERVVTVRGVGFRLES